MSKALDNFNKMKMEYLEKHGVAPVLCYMTPDEGFDLLRELEPSLPFTPEHRSEVLGLLISQNVQHLQAIFNNSKILDCHVKIVENLPTENII